MAAAVGASGLGGIGWNSALQGVAGHVAAGAAAVDDQVDQAVGPQPVGAVDADAGALARRVEAGDDRAVRVADDPAVDVGRDARPSRSGPSAGSASARGSGRRRGRSGRTR